jgi:16S rRNA (uracil1498-N3)-methyltransferase
MHRFFLPRSSFEGEWVRFPEETASQIHRVLRLKPGQIVIALDGEGREYEVRLRKVENHHAEGLVLLERMVVGEPRFELTLLLAITQREKFEWMLQKCTELGAAHFVPVICARSLSHAEREAQKKLDRWQKIVKEAAEQSRRGRIPLVNEAVGFEEAVGNRAAPDTLKLIAWEGEETKSLSAALRAADPRPVRARVLVGPEGGFETQEVALAAKCGFAPVSLGRRILRMETAAMVCTALTMYEMDEMER